MIAAITGGTGSLAVVRNILANIGSGELPMALVLLEHVPTGQVAQWKDKSLTSANGMPVVRAESGVVIEKGKAYLMPHGAEPPLNMHNAQFQYADDDPASGDDPIDCFIRALAAEAKQWSVAVILSGQGSVGSRGIRHVYEANGLVLCQDEDSAEVADMPRNAQDTGFIDALLVPGDMAEVLMKRAQRESKQEAVPGEAPVASPDDLTEIFQRLRGQCGIDFHDYKPTTVMRRLQRRLAMHELSDFAAYLSMLDAEPKEIIALYHDLLVGVTKFFRNPEAFLRLETDILPGLVRDASLGANFRVWIAGCASGEEVYTVAMLVAEALRAANRTLPVKIFATDIHPQAIETASAARYSEKALVNIPDVLRKRYFVATDGGFQIVQQLRQFVVFAQHDLLTSAPFTRMDLVLCRNLLIYLKPAAQLQALSLLHFGLRKGGVLFLGPSESTSMMGDKFEPLDDHWKIYRKRSEMRMPLNFGLGSASTVPITPTHPLERMVPTVAGSKLLHLYDCVLERVMPPGLLADSRLTLLHTFAGAERFLSLRSGRADRNLLSLVCQPLRTPVSVAIEQARQADGPAEPLLVRFQDGAETTETILAIRVGVIEHESAGLSHMLITFEEQSEASAATIDSGTTLEISELTQRHIANLESELQFSRDHLQTTVEELDASNEELQAANEELVASNEELQSSNEEYQSVNEELQTVNTELKRNIAELKQLTSDMEGLLANTGLGVVFLDRHCCVRRFTPKMTKLFHFLPQDVGRSITHFASQLDIEGLDERLNAMMADKKAIHLELNDRVGTPYLLRASPYIAGHEVDGAVLTFVDVSPLTLVEEEAKQLEQMVESSHDAIICTDANGVVLRWNRGAEHLFGYPRDEAEGRSVIDLIVPPDLAQESLRRTRDACIGESVGRLETLCHRKDGRYLDILVSMDQMKDRQGKVLGVLAILQDNTVAKRLANGLAIEKEVALALAEAPTLEIALPSVVSAFSTVLGTAVVEMWKPSDDGTRLRSQLVHCSADSRAATKWRAQSDQLDFAKGKGLPGRIWESQAPLWIPDVTTESSFVKTPEAEALDLRSAFGFPILSRKAEVLGVLVFFLPYSRVSKPLPTATLASLGRVLANFVERRDSETAAAESRARLSAAVQHASVFVAQCDLELRYTWVAKGNPAFPPERVLGKLDEEILPETTVSILTQAKRESIKENRLAKCDVFIPFPDDERYFTSIFEPIHDPSGMVTGLSIIGFDITELYRAQRDQAQLASVLEATPDFVAMADPQGRILSLNPAARRMLGIPLDDDVVGMPLSTFHSDEAAKLILEEAISHALASPDGTWMGENAFRMVDGTEFPMSQVVIAKANAAGEVEFMATVARDLRERLQIEKNLRLLSETLTAVVHGLPDIVYVVNIEGKNIFNSEAADELGEALETPKLPLELNARISAALTKGENYQPIDFKSAHAIRIGDKVRHFLPQVTAFESLSGERLGALVVLQDITEFRLLDEIKTNLISTVSHELKTPLTSIRMPLLMVLDESEARGRLTDRQRKLLQSASDEVERMLTTLTTLLDLTRFEEGSQTISRIPCQPLSLIADAVSQMQNQASHSNLTFAVHARASLPVVSLDSHRIQHALTNLISNAIKHSPEGGTITVGARKLKSGMRFFVTDEGPGIPKEFHKRLFDRFFRRPGTDGSGLGLAIVREFVQAHGGKVGVKSAPGEGSTFHFTVPLKEEA